MSKRILLAAVVLSSILNLAHAAEPNQPSLIGEKKLTVMLDLTYTSKWLSKGVEAYGSKGGLFKTIDVEFYGTGLGLNVTHRNATSSGYVDQQRIDYRPYYKGSLFADTPYLMKYDISVGYESYTGLDRHKANTTYEWIYAFSWPKLLPFNLVPSYIAHYEYPAFSGEANSENCGWVHRFLLSRDCNLFDLPKPINLSSEFAYYDNLGNRGSDWGYATFGASTKLNITKQLVFVPGLYHQVTMDKRVSPHKDITYTMLSMRYTF